jgi:hypothetical protein
MQEPRLDAVLPLTLRDCERAQILLDSLEVFFPDLHTLHVIVPDHQAESVRHALRFSRLALRTESEVLPELSFWRRVFRASVVYRRRPDGWYVQQLAKLAGPRYVGSEHYLTFDADVVCCRPTRPSDLIRDGRSLCQRSDRGDEHADWYAWSERALDRKRTGTLSHGATPLLYATDAMRRLHAHLEDMVWTATRMAGRLLDHPKNLTSWCSVLLRRLPWAEHTLYHVFLESEGQFERYHVDVEAVGGRPLHDRSVWGHGEFEHWDPAAAFGPEGPYFCLVQSWLGIAPADVRRKLASSIPALASTR